MLLDGKRVYQDFFEKNKGKEPKGKLLIIDVGNAPSSLVYSRKQIELCKEFNIQCEHVIYPEDIHREDLFNRLIDFNIDRSIAGIIMHQPLSQHLKDLPIFIRESKDIEGENINNRHKLYNNMKVSYAPSTAQGIMELCNFYNIELEGKNVLIINRSDIIGKPLSVMMLNKNATVTTAHSYTKNLKELCQQADIVITAISKANTFTYDYFNENAIVIDASINIDENGKLCGDVVKDDYDKINMITPVPGGVGICTNVAMIKKLLK